MVKQFRQGERQSIRSAILKSKKEKEKINAANILINMKKDNRAANTLANMRLNREINNIDRDIVNLKKDIIKKQKELNKILKKVYFNRIFKKK